MATGGRPLQVQLSPAAPLLPELTAGTVTAFPH